MALKLLPVWREGERLLAAVSGGADSVALLLLLSELAGQGRIELCAAHFEHGIRGGESLRDQAFVRDLCARLGVRLYTGARDVPALARQWGVGLETAARRARYEFLRARAKEAGADAIALAHHADDQAETILMHLLRGGGNRGACGMRSREGGLIRPLLKTRKTEILAYLGELGQPFCVDSTNLEPASARNRLRLEVMPLLENIYPGAATALCRHGAIAARDEDFWRDKSKRLLDENARETAFGWVMRGGLELHDALLSRVFAQMTGIADFKAMERLLSLYRAGRGRMALPGGATAECAGGGFFVTRAQAHPPGEVVLLEDGAAFGALGRVRVRPCGAIPIRDDPWRQAVRAEALKGARLRARRAGDVIYPLGAPGKRLLSDYLTDMKLPRPLRDYVPLVAVENEALWVAGVGISQRLALRSGDQAVELTYLGERFELVWPGDTQKSGGRKHGNP